MKKIAICVLIGLLALPTYAGIQVTNNGDGTSTLTLTYTKNTTKVTTTLNKAAELLYKWQGIGLVYDTGNIVPYAELTNAQKLHVISVAVGLQLIEWAKRSHVTEAVESARETAENEDIFIAPEE